jgi:hypothetical protein
MEQSEMHHFEDDMNQLQSSRDGLL